MIDFGLVHVVDLAIGTTNITALMYYPVLCPKLSASPEVFRALRILAERTEVCVQL